LAYPPTDPEVMYDLARDRLDRQLGSIDAVDAKLGINFSIGSGLIGVAAGVYALNPATGWPPVVSTTVLYVALTCVCLLGLRLRKWRTGPQIEQVYQDHIDFTAPVMKWRTSDTLVNHYHCNEADYLAKVKWATWSSFLLLTETAVLVVGLASATLATHHS
jgi:hypothetical protein